MDRRAFLKTLGLTAPALALPAGGQPGPASEEPRRELPNIVIVLADDMGYGDPGCYNPASKIPTPRIDRIAAEGVRFKRALALRPLLAHPLRPPDRALRLADAPPEVRAPLL